MIQENIRNVQEHIVKACERSGRDPKEVTLIAVSKTKPECMVEEAYAAGTRDFGENKAQEMSRKYDSLSKDIRWHMIGHLQRNKVKYVVGKACLIHSVDSVRLAEAIQEQAQKTDVIMPVLIEVNVADEESKFGITTEETMSLVEEISKFPNISIKGLMTIAPHVSNPEENRWVFRKLKQLGVDIKDKNYNNVNVDILSMGMSGDYEVAIEEGATMVRVGTSIFGERNYNI
ncbi:MAG: YggS family pyridoxal phosphate-dependent enzyme [Lachnospiraceae bacterium]|nr:YggS family pyridoxal phosphate-dependent enzyme [Lachnospiraceae bacterium]